MARQELERLLYDKQAQADALITKIGELFGEYYSVVEDMTPLEEALGKPHYSNAREEHLVHLMAERIIDGARIPQAGATHLAEAAITEGRNLQIDLRGPV